MMKLQPIRIDARDRWNASLAAMPYAHVLQTWEWGDFKAATTGWQPDRIAFMNKGSVIAMAQILTRREGPFKIMYVPKGPVLDYNHDILRRSVLEEIKRYAHDNGASFIKIDPDVTIGLGIPGEPDAFDIPPRVQIQEEFQLAGFHYSAEQIQFRNSVIIDLRKPEDDLLMAMKQKTRYNVRLGPNKKGVEIRRGTLDDLDILYELYEETAERDNFIIRPLDYYRKAWGDFMKAGLAQPFIAEYKGMALAHVIIFGFGRRAWYFYGASSERERNRMPTYALQWEAIKWAKSQRMQVYDFWGAPDDFSNPEDPLQGVYRFKSGFGGTVVRRIGAWDYPARPPLYKAYTRLMPVVLGAMKTAAQLRNRRQPDTQGAA
ncbi:MAG: lipid II:glycine glycyltransferase FemX [Anaerolineae bacterium]